MINATCMTPADRCPILFPVSEGFERDMFNLVSARLPKNPVMAVQNLDSPNGLVGADCCGADLLKR